MFVNLIIRKLTSLIGSDRFWAATSGVLIMLLRDHLGLDAETATKIATIVIAWIAGQSVRPSHGDRSGSVFHRGP